MVFAKNPPMIKLKRNSLGVYHKRIQLESGFWDENCVYLHSISIGICPVVNLSMQAVNYIKLR